MDKNRIEGALDQAKGAVKEAIGKVTGNERLEAEGTADKLAGKAKGTVGETKDAVRNLVSK